MKILNKLVEISLENMNKKFDDDIAKDKTRVPYEIRIGRIDNKAEKDIDKEKDYVEMEDVGLLCHPLG